jgi:hypothetical protein
MKWIVAAMAIACGPTAPHAPRTGEPAVPPPHAEPPRDAGPPPPHATLRWYCRAHATAPCALTYGECPDGVAHCERVESAWCYEVSDDVGLDPVRPVEVDRRGCARTRRACRADAAREPALHASCNQLTADSARTAPSP